MTFDELLTKEVPKITLADFIRLCLDGNDDKVYIDIEVYDNRLHSIYSMEKDTIRIIDPVLQPYYDYQIIGLYTCEKICLILKEV